jgi:uncharacterized protein YndB with AHSA1/START domain
MTTREPTAANVTHNAPAKLSLPSDTEIIITRDFNAPRALVFEAMSKPEHVKRWYGLRYMPMPVCEIDLRVGGTWRFVLRDPESGIDHAFSGEYREIAPPDRIVFTERYEAIPGSDHVVTSTLTERDGKTTLTAHILYASKEHRDGHLASGMEHGMQETYDRLDELLATLIAQSPS